MTLSLFHERIRAPKLVFNETSIQIEAFQRHPARRPGPRHAISGNFVSTSRLSSTVGSVG